MPWIQFPFRRQVKVEIWLNLATCPAVSPSSAAAVSVYLSARCGGGIRGYSATPLFLPVPKLRSTRCKSLGFSAADEASCFLRTRCAFRVTCEGRYAISVAPHLLNY